MSHEQKIRKVNSMTVRLVEAHSTGVLVTGSRRIPITDRAYVIKYSRERNRVAKKVGYAILCHRDYVKMAQAAGMTVPQDVLVTVASNVTRGGCYQPGSRSLAYVNSTHMRRRPGQV